MEMWVY